MTYVIAWHPRQIEALDRTLGQARSPPWSRGQHLDCGGAKEGIESMNPTAQLSKEHRLIESVLKVFEDLATQAVEGENFDVERARDSLEFFRGFADRCHHGKEEGHLFPRLAAYGFSAESGPVAVMLEEHRLGRGFLREVAEALAEPEDERARDRFARAARSYVALLTAHIQKEDMILFPMADRTLSSDDMQVVAAGFEQVEREQTGEGAHERFHALADKLLEGSKR